MIRASFWAVRLIYILLFIVVSLTHNNISRGRNEVIRRVERVNYVSNASRNLVDITIETEHERVTTESGAKRLAKFKTGDTISIYYNYYGIPIYVSQPDSEIGFPLVDHLLSYGIIAFLTLLSLPMKAEDRFEKYYLWFVWYADIIAIGIYFLV